MSLILITWGRKLFGRVDFVPGCFYVATEFFYIWYFPLIPMKSLVVTQEGQKSWRGAPIGWSIKSILLAWLLPVSLLTWTLGAAVAGVILTGPHVVMQDEVIAVAVPAVALLLWILLLILPKRIRPKKARAVQLAAVLGMNEQGLAAVNACYP